MSLPTTESSEDEKRNTSHWNRSIAIVLFILGLWFIASLGCGILFRNWLDTNMPNVGNAPFGFWMAQQGAIMVFLLLLFIYMIMMNALDRQSGFDEGDQ